MSWTVQPHSPAWTSDFSDDEFSQDSVFSGDEFSGDSGFSDNEFSEDSDADSLLAPYSDWGPPRSLHAAVLGGDVKGAEAVHARYLKEQQQLRQTPQQEQTRPLRARRKEQADAAHARGQDGRCPDGERAGAHVARAGRDEREDRPDGAGAGATRRPWRRCWRSAATRTRAWARSTRRRRAAPLCTRRSRWLSAAPWTEDLNAS